MPTAESATSESASPCIGVCKLTAQDDPGHQVCKQVCIGCGRTLEQIATWTQMTKSERIKVVRECKSRLEKNGGFTLVELLVVIAIIGVLVALLLPAVQAAREAARRIQCTNNLKQMGLGFHNYHSAFHRFPFGGAGVVSSNNAAMRARWRPSWGTVLLPYIEQQSIYDEFDTRVPYIDEVNLIPAARNVATYLCPSAPKATMTRPNGDTPNSTVTFGRTDYGGNYGERGLRCFPNTNCPNTYADQGDSSGGGRGVLLFGTERQIGIADITDGSSNTAVLGESPEGLHSIWAGHKNLFDQSSPLNETTKQGSKWAACGPSFKSRNGNFCDFGQEFHSYHSGGVLFLLADGSARFISTQLELPTLAALLSRKGGEVISDF